MLIYTLIVFQTATMLVYCLETKTKFFSKVSPAASLKCRTLIGAALARHICQCICNAQSISFMIETGVDNNS